MHYSLHPTAKIKDPEILDRSWSAFLSDLTKDPKPPVPKAQRADYPAFSPVDRTGPLTKGAVTTVSCYVWDLDEDGHRIQELLPLLPSYFAYTTMSHTDEAPRWRVVVPLSRPVDAADWDQFWRTCNRLHLSLNDPYVKDCSRLYFPPDSGAEILTKDGPPLSVSRIMSQAIPTELVSMDTTPIDVLDFKTLSSKLQAKKSERAKDTAAKIDKLVAGIPYADDGDRDIACFHICQALVREYKDLDLDGAAKVFEPVHVKIWGDSPNKVRDKLERLQRKELGLPDAGGIVLHDSSDHVIAGRILNDLAPAALINGEINQYKDGTWKPQSKNQLYSAAEKYVGAYVVSYGSDFKLNSVGFNGIRTTLHLRASPGPEPIPGICFKNGFLRLPGTELEPHSSTHGARFKVSENYDPDASYEAWSEVLEAVFPGQPKTAMCLAEFVGACLAGIAPQFDKALIMLGPQGSNGKSTVQTIIQSMFEPAAVISLPPQKWHDDYYKHYLFKAAINIVGETPSTKVGQGAVFKNTISGDRTNARPIFGEPFFGRPLCGHLLAANKMFDLEEVGNAIDRRLLFLPFRAQFSGTVRREDIVERCTGPGLFVWALEGLRRLLEQGHYTEPEGHEAELIRWRQDGSPLVQWLEEATEPGELTPSATLYKAYQDWYMKSYQGMPKLDGRQFATQLPGTRVSRKGASCYPLILKDSQQGKRS